LPQCVQGVKCPSMVGWVCLVWRKMPRAGPWWTAWFRYCCLDPIHTLVLKLVVLIHHPLLLACGIHLVAKPVEQCSCKSVMMRWLLWHLSWVKSCVSLLPRNCVLAVKQSWGNEQIELILIR